MVFDPLDTDAVDLLLDIIEWAANEEEPFLQEDLFTYANELLRVVV